MPLPPPSPDFPPELLPDRADFAVSADEPLVLGIDEAGRGPVLGPMVYALFLCPESSLRELSALGAADSKALGQASRQAFFRRALQASRFSWLTTALTPNVISEGMLRDEADRYNLNELSYDTVYGLLERAQALLQARSLPIAGVFVDTLGTPESYRARLEARFPQLRGRVTVSAKADALYPVVSAASIIAKVTRDYYLEHWQFAEQHAPRSRVFGCGYTSDPVTVAWLRDNLDPIHGFPDIVRLSWSTCQRLLDELAARVDFGPAEPCADAQDRKRKRGATAGQGGKEGGPVRLPRGMSMFNARLVDSNPLSNKD